VREQANKLKLAKLKVDWQQFPKGHTIYGQEEVSAIREFVQAGYNCLLPEAK
jgi:hypothetical protein